MKTPYNYNETAAKFKFFRLKYYFCSLTSLLSQMDLNYFINFIYSFLGQPVKIIHLRKHHLVFKFLTKLDLLTLKEVVIDEEYFSNGYHINRDDKIIVDIGAGFGDFAILCAKIYPRAYIFAFEPDPAYFSLLKENIKLNNAVNIIPLSQAIYSITQVFKFIQSNTQYSSRCDFLKMDCEGCEFKIINTRDKSLFKKIKKLVMEYHEDGKHKVAELIEILQEADFNVSVYPRKEVRHIGILKASKNE